MSYSVIVTACGAGNGFSLISAAKQFFPDIVKHGVDVNPHFLNSTAQLCDRYHQAPPILSSEYPGFLESILRNVPSALYFPLIDHEFIIAADICRSLGVKQQGLRIGEVFDADKHSHTLKLQGIVPTPRATVEITEAWDAEKYVIKPRAGYGSRGLKFITALPENIDSGYLLQEFIGGREYTLDCFYDSDSGEFFSVSRERIEVKSGVCTKARVGFNSRLHEYGEKVGRAMGFDGGFCLQFIETGGDFWLTDINPRLGAGSSISSAVGCNFFAAAIAYASGKEYRAYLEIDKAISRYVTRQYREIVSHDSR